MSISEQFKGYLREFGEKTGLGELDFDEDGVSAIEFGPDLVLHFAPGDGSIDLFSSIGPASAQTGAEMHRLMLEASYADLDVGGGFLCLDPEGRPALRRRLSLQGLTYQSFEAAVGDMMEAAEIWSRRAPDPRPPEADDDGDHEVMNTGIRV